MGYIKAIDELKKVRKHRSELARQFETEAGYLKANRDKCMELQSLKEDKERKIEDIHNRTLILDDERQVNNDKCNLLSSQLKEVTNTIAKKDALESKIGDKSYSIGQIRSALRCNDAVFRGSDEALNDLIENHDKISEDKKTERSKLAAKIDIEKTKIDQLTSDIEQKKDKLGELKTELVLHEKDCASRDKLISELANDYELTGFDGSLSQNQIDRFNYLMFEKLTDLNTRREKVKDDFQMKEKEAQESVDKYMLDLATCEESIKRGQEELLKSEK